MPKERKPILDLPLKLIFTEEGINFFIKNKKKLNRFKMADDVEEYGIFLDKFSPPSVQRMMLIDYISKVEISRTEFMSKRQEIMDLSKLIVYAVLYKQLDNVIFDKVIKSDLIKLWNRKNPANIIDDKTRINDSYLEKVLSKNQKMVHEVMQEILDPIFMSISNNSNLLPEEKNIQLFLSEKFMKNLRPFNWFILSRFKGTQEYFRLIDEMRDYLRDYMEKSRIAEYLSLMIMELAINAENTNIQNFAKKVYRGSVDPQAVLYDTNIRTKILTDMEKRNEQVFLSWRMGGKSGSIGTKGRLQVTIYNKESEYAGMKQSIDEKKQVDSKKTNLMDFYKDGDETQGANTELGLYYLSYLNEACEKVNVRFESLVNQIQASDLTVITLTLHF
ncbi:MAG: hypothetical protein ACLFR1_16225 [Spirochaetia bacterium]